MTDESSQGGSVAPDHQLIISEMRQQLDKYERAFQAQQQQPPEADDDFIDLRELFNVLRRRRWTVIVTAVLLLVGTLIATMMMTPIYRATTTVQIERESGKVVEYENVVAEESAYSYDFYETQYELLRSRSLARRVIDQLGLQQTAALAAEQQKPGLLTTLVQTVKGLLGRGDEKPAPVEARGPDLEGMFLANLTVQPVSNSRLVRLHYNSSSPEEAALVVNALAKAFVDMSLERRFEASTYAKSFLEERIKQVRADLEDSERALVEYTQQRGIINQDDKVGILTDKLRTLNTALVEAESRRFGAEAEYQEMLAADSDSLAQMLNSVVIQNLKGQLTELQSERREAAKIFKPAYPSMLQLDEKIEQVKTEIANEIAAIREGIKLQYQAALREEAKLSESVADTRADILALQGRSTDFQTLKREVDTNRELYDGLLQRMKEVGVAAGAANNNISVVDPAQVPRYRYKPSLSTNLALALVLGLFAGVGLAFLFEMLDDTVKSSGDLEKLLDKPVLGVIPKVRGSEHGAELLAHEQPTSAFAEAYRSMRTALMFSTAQGAPKVLHFTSMNPGEGKTTSAISTAVNFAQTGSQVLLIDADLRSPSLHKLFGLPNQRGLTNYLTGETEPANATQATGVNGLYVMSSGPIPPNPAELLTGARLVDLASLAAKRFDYVIIDGPPLMGLADALILADAAQATLLVAAANSTRLGALEAGFKRLRHHSRARLLGAVLTKLDTRKAGYGYGYDYQYHYSYGASDRKAEAEAA